MTTHFLPPRDLSDRHDPAAFLGGLTALVASPQPAVVFASLAAICVPQFSDACLILIEEDGGVRYHLAAPHPGPTKAASPQSRPQPALDPTVHDLLAGTTLSTEISAPPFDDQPGYRGVVTHRWSGGHRPTPVDAALSDFMVALTHALIAQQRLDAAPQRGLTTEILELRHALTGNRDVHVAIGVLMTRRGLSEDAAFTLLRDTARSTGRSLDAAAADVLHTGSLDTPDPGSPVQTRPSRPLGGRNRMER